MNDMIERVLEGKPIKCSHCGAATTQCGNLPDECTGECARVAEDQYRELNFSDAPIIYTDWNDEADDSEYLHSIVDLDEWEENYEEE